MQTYQDAVKFLNESSTIDKVSLQAAIKLFPKRFIQEWRLLPYFNRCDYTKQLLNSNYTFREIADHLILDKPSQLHICPVCGKEIHSTNRRYPKCCSHSCSTKLQLANRSGKPLPEPVTYRQESNTNQSTSTSPNTTDTISLIRSGAKLDKAKLAYLLTDKHFNHLKEAGHTLEDIRVIIKEGGPLEPKLCSVCHKHIVHLYKGANKFKLTCSKACATKLMQQTSIEKYGVKNGGGSQQALDKAKQTNLKRYNTDFAIRNPDIKAKQKQTNLSRYGAHSNLCSNTSTRQAIKEANKLKYGSVWPMQNKQVSKYSGQCKSDKYYYNVLLNLPDIRPNFTRDEWTGCGPGKIYKWQCLKCNRVFEAYINGPSHLPICRHCHPYSISSGQEALTDYIKSIYPGQVIINNRQVLDGKEIDIYLPELKLGFEYNGDYYHSKHEPDYHLGKTELAESKGIHLIHIFEHEWLSKPESIKRRIHNLLVKEPNRLFARKTVVKPISAKESEQFLDTYHLQGNCPAQVKLGLFYNTELVAVMTFGKPRFNKKFQWELLRFATSKPVVGGASKLLKYFELNYKPQSLISYADRKWSNIKSNVYSTLGFSLLSTSKPSYYYIKSGLVLNRYAAQKSKLKKLLGDKFNPDLSESENMLINGYLRVFDCGNLVYSKLY